jgi:ferredoxin--NADP+ reductase
MTLQVAVIGSGPAGCYLVERLVREAPGCRIDVIDRLPTPYGLVRAGVAPDHQSTKSITRVFDRALTREGVAFRGNVTVGRDVTLAELRRFYDAVVIATGAPRDRRLSVPGEDLAGIIGSGAFVGWYNGHPDHAALAPNLRARLANTRSAVIVGNGNVALDVARILAKTPTELAVSDIAPDIGRSLAAAPLRQIHIVGRRGPDAAGFSPQELSELGELARASPIVAASDLAGCETAPNSAIIAILRDFAQRPSPAKPIELRFHFHARPLEFIGAGRVESARFATADGGVLSLPADLVMTCIGYRAEPCDTLAPADAVFANERGLIEPGLYVVGWAKRGPSGTIATNRTESHEVAQRLAAEVGPGVRPGRAGLDRLLAERGVASVDFAAWQRIDATERARAAPGRPREKLVEVDALLAAARA